MSGTWHVELALASVAFELEDPIAGAIRFAVLAAMILLNR